jgi:hypothetical protein
VRTGAFFMSGKEIRYLSWLTLRSGATLTGSHKALSRLVRDPAERHQQLGRGRRDLAVAFAKNC